MTILLILGVSLVLVLETWVMGELRVDPLDEIPLALEADSVRFKSFRPELKHPVEGKYATRFENGVTAVYTIDPIIQKTTEKFLKKYKVPYGVFVAINPKTGKVLSMSEHSSRDPRAKDLALRATYPAASIFKLVTASAAIEEKKALPGTEIAYQRDVNRLRPKYLNDNPKRDRLKASLSTALAKSNNVVFAKVALRWLNVPTLLDYGERFGFNRPISFEKPLQMSPMIIEESEMGLARAAAGFGKVGLSPLHAALIGAAIANDGVMMSPCMIDSVLGPEGEKLYDCIPKELTRSISSETASYIQEMMARTVARGTVRKVFRRRRRGRDLRGISIGGKTGSLRGKNPKGRYSWFIGMAPLEDPEIAFAAMVVNDPIWHIRAPELAKTGLSAYFKSKRLRNKQKKVLE
ncbi:MAG: penicillin-binding transpeptidase domain-containing protein [Nitrospiria bacterium]